jgi:DNA-directed RNA polymerase subunit L
MTFPIITDIHKTENDILKFTLKNADVCIANALRRTIIGNIKAVVMSKDNCNITTNTTRFNNEIIKQLLSCIPVCLTPDEEQIKTFTIQLNKSNNTSHIVHVTSEDFKILENGKETDKKLFMPNEITGQYIDILRLRPKLGLAIESISLSATLTITTGSQSGTSNLGNCYYKFTVNHEVANREWIKTGNDNKEDKKDWDLLQAKRFTIPGSYDFTVESYEMNIYSPEILIKIACKTIQYDLNTFKTQSFDIQKSENTLENCIDVVIENCDFTIGKLLEYYIFTTKFPTHIKYISFLKNHPHDKHGILKLQYNDSVPTHSIIEELLTDTCEQCKAYFNFSSNF